MAETKTEMTPEEQAEAVAAEEQKRAEEFRKLLDTPMTKAEAEKALADIEIQLAQLAVQRVRAVESINQANSQLNQIDHSIAVARFDQQVIYRRTLNTVPGKKGEVLNFKK